MWKDFHDFWLKAKIPVHLIRYEDIVLRPRTVFPDLFKFILNVESIEGTKIMKYIELATEEKAPEIYKPRKGAVHNNKSKYSADQLQYMLNYAPDLIKNLAYAPLFGPEEDDTLFV